MKYTILVLLTIVAIAACKKNRTEPQAGQTAHNSATIDSPAVAAFTSWTDTFKGGGVSLWDSYKISDSVVFFYVHHFVRDSFEITSDATFQYDENSFDGLPLKLRLRYNKSGIYPPGSTFPDIVFKQDSILYKWSYRYELKMPSGGVHYDTYTAYGRRIN